MRKIEQWMIDTIKSQRLASREKLKNEGITGTKSNTMVCTRLRFDYVVVTTVYLHGNMIAQFSGDGWGFNLCRWPTPTTRSRINAICREFGRVGVSQSKGKQWCGNNEIPTNDWFWPRKS